MQVNFFTPYFINQQFKDFLKRHHLTLITIRCMRRNENEKTLNFD